ncbi:MAG TPA: HlyD family secretion protein [Polyangiaceae bacterium]
MASTQPLENKPLQEVAPQVVAPARKGKTRPYIVLGAVVTAGLLAWGVASWMTRGKETTDDAQVDADVVAVSTRVGGTVKVHVADNQQVTKGTLLAEIDSADYVARAKESEAKLAAARAKAQAADAQVAIASATSKGGLSVARAQLSGSTTSAASAEAHIADAKAALAGAQAQSNQADTDLARGEALLKDQAIPRAQVDSARSAAQAAHAAVARAQAQLAAAQEEKRTAQTRIAESAAKVEESAPVDAELDAARAGAALAHAEVDSADAELTQARLQLSYTRIEAPADGLLSRLAVHDGQLVQAGQQVVSVVPSATYVVANFKETQVGAMKVGQSAEIRVDAYPGRTFEGKVDSTSPGTGARFSLLPPDNASGNFVKVVQRVPVKITWVNVPGDARLAAGMSADVTVVTR